MLSVTEKFSQDQSEEQLVHLSTTSILSEENFLSISVVLLFILQIINIIGLICNSLSIAVFVKLGYSEPSNISLTALAISDLVSMVLSLWANLYFLLNFRDTVLPVHASNVSFLTGGSPWAYVIRTVAWITAFISFKRCLCILVPLKVKRLITERSTFVVMLIIFTLTFGPFLFTYVRYKFVWVFHPYLNATILDVVPINNKYFILTEKIILVICGVIQPLLAFLVVIICTVFLVIQLQKISLWRLSATSAKGQSEHTSGGKSSSSAPTVQDRISQKEERIVRMVVMIAPIFIVSYTPTCVMLLCNVVLGEFNFFGVYRRIYILCGLTTCLAQAISGSANILIYYYIASRFRSALHRLLHIDQQEK